MSDIKCSYCNDTGQIRTKGREREFRGRTFYEEDASPCVCVLNKYLSQKFTSLNSLPDALPQDAIKAAKRYATDTFKTLKKEDQKSSQRFQHRDLIFYGDESKFFYILKCYFLFFYKYHTLEYLEGLQVVQKYYVEQPKGEYRNLYDLNNFDLLVISFTSKPNNVALQDVILEVIKNRSNLGKATWIYGESLESILTSKEYSDGVDGYVKDFPNCGVSQNFSYEGFSLGTQVNPAEKKKDISKKLATDFS